MASNTEERIYISSAIPSMQLTLSSLPSRPNPSGSLGRSEALYTNHFTCSFEKNIPLYQYDVAIEEQNTKSGVWYEVKGRAQCARIMQSLISTNQFNSQIVVWYDEQKCLYSTSILPTPQTIISTDNRNRLNIKSLANQWSTNDIDQYINGQSNMYPYDAVRILETLLKKSLENRIKIVNNKCYFINKNSQIFNNGFEERHGFIQSLNLSSHRLTLNIQTKLTTFYSSISLLDFISKQLGSNRFPTENDYKKLNRILKNCLIVTKRSNREMTYEFDRFDHRKPGEISIETGETLIEYYGRTGDVLTKTNYPCIQVYKPNDYTKPCHLPLELCKIKEWQVYDKPLSKAEEAQQPRTFIPEPGQRYLDVMNTLRECNYNSTSLCRAVNFHIDDTEMLQLNSRILTQPEIQTGPNHQAKVRIGRIPLDGHLFTPQPISQLAITYFGSYFQRNKQHVERFIDNLVGIMKDFNIYGQHEEHIVQPNYEDIDGYFRGMNERNCQFIVCIMEGNDTTQLRTNIKDCGTLKHGIMTQCAMFSKISNPKALRSYCENLIRKINFKNAGINTQVNLNIALKNKKSQNDDYMFFGADVIHPTNVSRQHPSIAAIVGSGDSLCSTTAVRVCQQYPKDGKCSIETIIGMTEMIEQLLDYYGQSNGVLPNKIVFYRDGVDDGQFGKILAHEIPAIRQAFNTMYGDPSEHPLLTFLVVKKRHNTRFFTYNKTTNTTDNISIGSVIDTTIVHPYQNNFYLNSHKALQGVNRPSFYHVILDEINFTSDELQLLTYHLCFTDPRSSSSEAIPSIVHQADIAALKARDLFYDDESSSATSIGGRSRPLKNPTLNDLDYKILDVHENLRNLPIFG